jgi:quercetin dioxygenase-like cupin family protein
MAPDGRHDPEAVDLDPRDAETLRLLGARDRTPTVDPVFAARLLADLEDEIAARGRVQLHSLVVLPHLTAYRDEPLYQQNGHRPSPPPAAPMTRKSTLGWVGSQLATAALLVLVVLASLTAAGSFRLSRGLDPFPVLGVQHLDPASPDPATAHGLLTQMTVPALPAAAGWIGIERWTLAPRTDPIAAYFSGPAVIFVISGQLTVTLDQPGQIVHGLGRQQPDPFLAGSPGAVAAGETLLAPPDVNMATGNDTDAPATALFVSVIKDTPRDWETAFAASKLAKIQSLVSDKAREFAPGPGRIELSRVTLQPGETLPPPEPGTYRLVGAESTYLGYLRRSPDGSVTNLEKTPLTVLILTITQDYPTLTSP